MNRRIIEDLVHGDIGNRISCIISEVIDSIPADNFTKYWKVCTKVEDKLSGIEIHVLNITDNTYTE